MSHSALKSLLLTCLLAIFASAEEISIEISDEGEGVAAESASLLQPVPEPAPPASDFAPPVPSAAAAFAQSIFASGDVRQSLVNERRRSLSAGIASELVFGSEGKFRVTTDGGNLLGKSPFAPSVRVQQRTPIITDPRVRSDRYARLLASGSYWAPARQDLDTLLSKVDSRIIRDIIVIKGPYSVQYGPGFDFVDFEFYETPRYECGYEAHGLSSIEYKTNGEQIYGRQAFWGGGSNWGYRVGYGHRTGNDYDTGHAADGSFFQPESLPTSYNSRIFDAAIGYDLAPDRHLEFVYLRLDQTNVEFPGLVFDINSLKTDGYEVKYTVEDQVHFDLMTAEAWYNRTEFDGDTSRPGKNIQIPAIRDDFELAPDQFLVTNVDGMSAGYRVAFTWGQMGCPQWTLGTDYIRQSTQLNDIVPERDSVTGLPPPLPPVVTLPERNFPIPRSHSDDFGLFVERSCPVNDCLSVRMGARIDIVESDADDFVPGLGEIVGFPPTLVEMSLSDIKQAGLRQHFTPVSLFATADYRLNCCWTLTAGAGYAVRPPDLTELYAAGPFIGVLQPGLSFVEGDPELDPERLTQIDLGLHGDFCSFRLGVNAFHAWINDYIIFDDIGIAPMLPGFEPGQTFQRVAFGNTDLATLTGFELSAEYDISCCLSAFALSSFVEGRDHDRSAPSRIGALIRDDLGFPPAPRSQVDGVDEEPLPGIPPLEARLGLRWHEPVDAPTWAIELEARIVDAQDRVAASLFEQRTGGFTIWNLRSYWQATEHLLLIAGVENFTDQFYREHLDYRSGRGVYRPGISFYFSSELQY